MDKPFVLLADDNEATCTLIAALLRNDFAVDVASDGQEAIEKLKSRRYSAVLLDLLMPVVDGYGVLDFITSERPSLLSRVIVVTASLSPRALERVRAYDICTVVAKPFEIDALFALVRQCAQDDAETPGSPLPLISSGVLLLLADLIRRV